MKKIVTLCVGIAALLASFLPAKIYSNEACTLDRGFWRNHPDSWPTSISLDTQIAKKRYGDILRTPTNGMAWYILAHEWLTASLNAANGAPSEFLKSSLQAAKDLLERGDFSLSPTNLAEYITLTSVFQDYNNGMLVGCEACADDITVVCPPCPACCCPACPMCPECPKCEPTDCNCHCDFHLKEVHKDCSKSSSSSEHCHHRHHYRHHYSHHRRHNEKAAKQKGSPKKKPQFKKLNPRKKVKHGKKPGAHKKGSGNKKVLHKKLKKHRKK